MLKGEEVGILKSVCVGRENGDRERAVRFEGEGKGEGEGGGGRGRRDGTVLFCRFGPFSFERLTFGIYSCLYSKKNWKIRVSV